MVRPAGAPGTAVSSCGDPGRDLGEDSAPAVAPTRARDLAHDRARLLAPDCGRDVAR